MRDWLQASGFHLERQLSVSHFRIGLFKRLLPLRLLVWMDSLAQFSGNLWQLTPSVFARCRSVSGNTPPQASAFFRCPACCHAPLADTPPAITCPSCSRTYAVEGGIYDFRLREKGES